MIRTQNTGWIKKSTILAVRFIAGVLLRVSKITSGTACRVRIVVSAHSRLPTGDARIEQRASRGSLARRTAAAHCRNNSLRQNKKCVAVESE